MFSLWRREAKPVAADAKIYADITQHEIAALKVDYNLADAHTHQAQSPTQRAIVERLPALWYESERHKQHEMEQRFLKAFFRVLNRPRALSPNNAMLVYAASIAMAIAGLYLQKRKMSVSLIEPCFDNIHDLLAHMNIPMEALTEDQIANEDTVYRNLERTVTADAIFIVDPNNPTGFTIFDKGPGCFREIVRFAKDKGKILMIDFCFAAFMARDPRFTPFDPYEILEDGGVTYVAIEDTGKTWPLQDAKAAILKCSRDIHQDIYNIHTSYLLNVSPFILNVVTNYVLDSEKDNFASVYGLLDRNRAIARRVLEGSTLEYQEPMTNVSVAWFKIRDPRIVATDLQKIVRDEGAYILPGTYFYWKHPERGERYVRVALARDTAIFEPAVKLVRAAVDAHETAPWTK